MSGGVLAGIRKDLMKTRGTSEQELLSQGSIITSMFEQVQALKLEMNEAKREAAAAAAAPYLEAIEKIERRHAMFIKLMTN